MKMKSSIALASIVALTGWLFAASSASPDKFAVALSPSNNLQIFSPTGEKVADLPPATVGRLVTMAPVSFLVSFGKDVNGLWTALISPNPEKPASLAFSVAGENVEMDNESSVTLAFTNQGRAVQVDPGFIGQVKVNQNVAMQTMVAAIPPSPPQEKGASSAPSAMPSNASSTAPTANSGVAPEAMASSPNQIGADSKSKLLSLSQDKKAYWSEPVSNVDPAQRIPVASSEMKFSGITGGKTEVSLTPDFKDAKLAANGDVVPSGAYVSTGDGAAAGVIFGGVSSVKLTDQTQVEITQDVQNGVRSDTVDLKQGSVFARVGKRANEKQDYKIKTPSGIAAARGTQFFVSATPNGNGGFVVNIVTKEGVVDKQGTFKTFDFTVGGDSINVASSDPNLTRDQAEQILVEAFDKASESNPQLKVIFQKIKIGQPLSPDEQAFLTGVETVLLEDVTVADNPPAAVPEDVKLDSTPRELFADKYGNPVIDPTNPKQTPGDGFTNEILGIGGSGMVGPPTTPM